MLGLSVRTDFRTDDDAGERAQAASRENIQSAIIVAGRLRTLRDSRNAGTATVPCSP